MFARSSSNEALGFIVAGNDKKRARLNCTSPLLSPFDDTTVPHQKIHLPDRLFDLNCERATLPPIVHVIQVLIGPAQHRSRLAGGHPPSAVLGTFAASVVLWQGRSGHSET